MTKHEFIFSDQRKHRIARHVVFWLTWCIAYDLLFHFPIHVFKGWDLSGPGSKNYRELGPVLFFIKTLLVNSLFAVIVPQIALGYVVIYWLLPGYFYKRKNYFVTALVVAAILVVFNFVAVVFKHSSSVYNSIVNSSPLKPEYISTQRVVIIDQLSSLPLILGFALVIKLAKRWWLKQKQTEQLAKEKIEAVLQLLKAQIHPHFLFNTINNIYFYTLTNSAQAPVMIKKLSGLLHYILNECAHPFVPLEKEAKMIADYLTLEKIRYADQLQLTVDIAESDADKTIAPLLLIPFVENSFKHGASKMITNPWVKVVLTIENNILHFTISNNKPAVNEPRALKGNIGLKNVKKRLELLYPGTHELTIASDQDIYTVQLNLLLNNTAKPSAIASPIKPPTAYAMA